MNYIENIYVCLAAPFLIAAICLSDNHRRTMIFILGGMTACLLSSYISTYLSVIQNVDTVSASINIAPIVEEIMKLLPVLFYLVVFEPEKDKAIEALVMISIGFATFENVCYLTQNGAEKLMFLIIRGFGTGTMHVVCGMMIAIGLLFLWEHKWLRAAGLFGLLTTAITYHSLYNMMVSQSGAIATLGYIIPIATVSVVMSFREDLIRRT